MNAPARPLRRRARRSLRARVRTWWVVAMLAMTLGAVAAYEFATWPALRVHSVAVRGNKVVETPTILAKAAIDPGMNAWLLDTHAVARRVDAIPYVLSVKVERRLPAEVTLAVTERVPTACLTTGWVQTAIDATGRALQRGCDPALTRFVLDGTPVKLGEVATDPRVPRLQADVSALQAEGFTARSLRFDRFGDLVAVDEHGLQVLFGTDDDLAAKARLISPILAQATDRRAVRAIDLRAPSTPVIVTKQGATP